MRGKLWELLDSQSLTTMDDSTAADFAKSMEITQDDRTELLRLAADGDENARGAYLDSLVPVMLSRMKTYADVIGYPKSVIKAIAGSAEEYLDSVRWTLDQTTERDLVRQIQYAATRECLDYRKAHAVELLPLKLDGKSRSEYSKVREHLKSVDEKRLADTWLSMSDQDRQIIYMGFDADGKYRPPEEVASALQIPRERVRLIQRTFFHRLNNKGCAISKRVLKIRDPE